MFAHKKWRICAALIACIGLLSAADALAATTVRVCTTCSTEAQVTNDAYVWGRTNVPAYGVFIDTTPAPYAIQRCFQHVYNPYYNVNTVATMPMSSCPNPGPPLDGPPPPPVLPTGPVEQWMVSSSDYYVKAGDYNRDGLYDFYVTGRPTKRFVKDFIIYNNGSTYTVNANPSATDRAMADTMPLTMAKVMRVDLNGDALYDFLLSDTGNAVPGHSTDVVVLTNKGGGSVPQTALPLTQQMKDDAEALIPILADLPTHFARSHTTYCYRIDYVYNQFYRPDFIGSNTAYPGPITTEADRQLAAWLSQGTPLYYPNLASYCYSGMVRYSPAAQRLLTQAEPTAQGPDTALILSAILTPQWNSAILQRGMICANNDTVAMSNVAASVANVALGYTIESALVGTAEPVDILKWLRDVARQCGCGTTVPVPSDPPTSESRPDTSSDTNTDISIDIVVYRYAECQDPEKPDQSPSGASPNSARLRRNLHYVGCDCPEGDSNEVHHIVAIKGASDATKATLRQCGIELDYAINGVCLPTKDTSKPGRTVQHTETFPRAYYTTVDQRIANAYSAQQCEGVKSALKAIRHDLLYGNRFWQSWLLPF